jgi:hypothetical protein
MYVWWSHSRKSLLMNCSTELGSGSNFSVRVFRTADPGMCGAETRNGLNKLYGYVVCMYVYLYT